MTFTDIKTLYSAIHGHYGDALFDKITLALTTDEAIRLAQEVFLSRCPEAGDRGSIMGIKFVVVDYPEFGPPALDIDHD